MSLNVEVRRADFFGKPAVYNLLQIYLHHFSSLTKPGDPKWRFNAFGQFDYPGFDDYWTDKKLHPYLVYADTHLAGFALINDSSASGRPVDFFMQEFFIGGKYRGHGIGRKAARAIFAHHPGQWEFAIVPGNAAVAAFWDKALKGADIRNFEKFTADGRRWPAGGPIFRFSV